MVGIVAAGGGGQTLVASTTVSAAANADLAFDSTAWQILFLYGTEIVIATGGQTLAVQFSQSSTFLEDASDYSYVSSGHHTNNSTTPVVYAQSDNAHTHIFLIPQIANGSFVASITNFNGGFNARISARVSGERTTSAAEATVTSSGRLEANTDAIDGVRILSSSGNISGTFMLYGLPAI